MAFSYIPGRYTTFVFRFTARLALPTQPVDATPSRALIGQCLRGEPCAWLYSVKTQAERCSGWSNPSKRF